jgi:hypothetical protein
MSDTWDEDDRAIARALHEPDDGGPADERAVTEYREVLAHLPFDDIAPPGDLEDRTMAAALARRPASATALSAARSQRRSRVRAASLGALAVAAAIVVAVLVTTRDTSSHPPKGRIAAVSLSRDEFDALVREPGTRTGGFDRAPGTVALTPAGNGGIFGLTSALAVNVWLDTKRGTTSLGSATPQNGVILFSVDHPDLVTAVRLTKLDGTEIARAALSGG